MKTFSIVCLIALAALVPVPVLQAVLATTASTLFESTPFILAAVALTHISPGRARRFALLFGCGCVQGPAALCLPVAAATVLTFGPLVAALRWVAALAFARIFRRRHPCIAEPSSLGGGLLRLLPFSAAAGIFSALPWREFTGLNPILAAFVAAGVAVAAAPCGFGLLALAAR
ncbi:MAG: hypothetical protein NVS9B12_02030 [Vulcanimicrobiaceae bacterium]